jgi:hypothetical protein
LTKPISIRTKALTLTGLAALFGTLGVGPLAHFPTAATAAKLLGCVCLALAFSTFYRAQLGKLP